MDQSTLVLEARTKAGKFVCLLHDEARQQGHQPFGTPLLMAALLLCVRFSFFPSLSFHSSVLDALPDHDVREYRAAVETVPGLVQQETPLYCFLAVTANNPIVAAQRIALFWKYRKVMFGERWLLPVSLAFGVVLGKTYKQVLPFVRVCVCVCVRVSHLCQPFRVDGHDGHGRLDRLGPAAGPYRMFPRLAPRRTPPRTDLYRGLLQNLSIFPRRAPCARNRPVERGQ